MNTTINLFLAVAYGACAYLVWVILGDDPGRTEAAAIIAWVSFISGLAGTRRNR